MDITKKDLEKQELYGRVFKEYYVEYYNEALDMIKEIFDYDNLSWFQKIKLPAFQLTLHLRSKLIWEQVENIITEGK